MVGHLPSFKSLRVPINWSAIDNRSVLGRALRLPLGALPKGMVMRICRGPAKGMKWTVGSSTHSCGSELMSRSNKPWSGGLSWR